MSAKLLGIVCSPRKHGNSELFIKELFQQLEGDWELELLRLPELEIRPCRACYRCLFESRQCVQKDDFTLALQALIECSAYVVACPTYLLGPNASLKLFLDRGLAFYGVADRLWGKPAVGVAIAGIEGLEGYTKLAVESFVKLTMGELRGVEVIYGALPGEIFLKGAAVTAKNLARALEAGKPAKDPQVSTCPLCGGDTFRFLANGQVRCMLCSSKGRLHSEEGVLTVETLPGDHPLFFSYEDVLRHAKWLQGMKEQFINRRSELKSIASKYTGLGSWVK